MKKYLSFLGVLTLTLSFPFTSSALDWTGAGTTDPNDNDNLSNAANWDGPAPVTGDQLLFDAIAGGNNTTVTVDEDFSGTLRFNGGNALTAINGGSTLTLDINSATASNGVLNNANSVTPVINANVDINNTQGGTTRIRNNGSSITFSGGLAVSTQAEFQAVGAGTTMAVNGVLSGGEDLSITGGGIASFGGSADNTFTGVAQVIETTFIAAKTGGAQVFTGNRFDVDGSSSLLQLNASDQFSTRLRLDNGGQFSLNGFSEDFVGALDLDGTGGLITFGLGDEALRFNNSSGQDWVGTLTITGFENGDTLQFGSNAGGLTEDQLALITINGLAAQIDASGFVTAVPEPSTAAALGLAAALLALRRRRSANNCG